MENQVPSTQAHQPVATAEAHDRLNGSYIVGATTRRPPWSTLREGGKYVWALFVGLPAVLFWMMIVLLALGIMNVLNDEQPYCNVAHVPLHGIVTATEDGFMQLVGSGVLTSADVFVHDVVRANEDEQVDAIIVDVNSPGGTPVAADEMMQALLDSDKPVVAVVRDLAASAAYWVVSGADYVLASPVSDVGSIGVTMSYLEVASSTEIEGSRWIDLSSGEYKDAGRPDRVLREEEQDFYRGQVDAVHEYMVDRIAEARAGLSREEVAQLADGRAYVGIQAFEHGLVDALGGFSDARSWMAKQLGSGEDEVVLCEPRSRGWSALF